VFQLAKFCSLRITQDVHKPAAEQKELPVVVEEATILPYSRRLW
jgi:hypothetical protein